MTIAIDTDLRRQFVAVRDQGQRPTCVAFSVSDAHGAARSSLVPMSPEHLLYHSVRYMAGATSFRGVTLNSALMALRKDGQCEERGWPYTAQSPADTGAWKPPPSAAPAYRRGSAVISHIFSGIVQAVDMGYCVVLILLLGSAFYRPIEGIVDVVSGEQDIAYHAVVAVGHGKKGSKQVLLVRNSWGPKWGVDGHAWLTEAYINQRANQAATLRGEVLQ